MSAEEKRKQDRIRAKEWYSKNREKAKAAALRRYHANKERAAERMRVWRAANKDQRNAYKREYYKLNRDKIRDQESRYAIKNRERITLRSRSYYLQNAEERRGYSRAYQKEKVKELDDRYIRRLLVRDTQLSITEIPPELAALKKKHLIIQRKLKQQKP